MKSSVVDHIFVSDWLETLNYIGPPKARVSERKSTHKLRNIIEHIHIEYIHICHSFSSTSNKRVPSSKPDTKEHGLVRHLVPLWNVRERFSACSFCLSASSSRESLCFSSVERAWPALTKVSGVCKEKKKSSNTENTRQFLGLPPKRSFDEPGLWTWGRLFPTHAYSTAARCGMMPRIWPGHQTRSCGLPTAAYHGHWHHHLLSTNRRKRDWGRRN